MRLLLVIILGILAAGCTYTTDLRKFDYAMTPVAAVNSKKVAVVLDPARVQDGHTTQTDVYSFKFTNVIDGLAEALQKRVELNAKEVTVVKGSTAPSGFDFYLYPEASLRSVHDFWTMGCFIEFKLEVKNAKGQLLAKDSSSGKRNFFSSNQFDEKCKQAMTEVFNKVVESTLTKVSL